ncbi:hypothetical protein [Sporolactobacillus spathodeae]|uniref:Uncharacterized protein n=1 Tax=Sporolactobacillus spathodeae TaxID=1465502 RepID=A0ABS2QA91_9BACL|nr:hypothetical protein [Sporolactobacillus spathodeae]MBM7658664.1 hypothetical protein [Sporolactobacillus spathodeae]
MLKNKIIILISCFILLLTVSLLVYLNYGDTLTHDKTKDKAGMLVKKFIPKYVLSGNESKYSIKINLDANGKFSIDTTTRIKNTSSDSWDKLIFYFIPNMFTKNNSPQLRHPATIHLNQILVNGKTNDYHLAKDTLSIPLNAKLKP